MSAAYEYMDEDGIDPELICSICCAPFNDPCCTPCGETFCRACLTNWLRVPNNTCPLCRQPLSLNVLKPATHLVRNILDRIRVKCSACGHADLEIGQFREHVQKVCGMRATSRTYNTADTARSTTRQQRTKYSVSS